MARTVSLIEAHLGAGMLSEAVTGSKEPADRMGMALEMLDIRALSRGREVS